jgi:pimeloyl-ACP methyl ester carboxylesterase
MVIESIMFSSPDVSDLKLPVKHYTPHAVKTVSPHPGFTLLFAHASGMHKEQWEPCIEILLASPKVHDAWSFDWPSHGHGAEVNAATLQAREHPMCESFQAVEIHMLMLVSIATAEWAKLLAAFCKMFKLNSSLTIAIGHSNGTTAL